ncbi:hypothetical protein CCR75_004567 [Bremia lactucae]|uniref:Uncharacterized protein n=1 Tax=Bremia lactucae TaxID=4779 RepID=A0A976IIM5_BRELC|nr:hypothetical protein CCR75_004567 [Bremia lactucae]
MDILVTDTIVIAILCFVIPVIACLIWSRRSNQAPEEVNHDRVPVHGPLLSLVGWKTYCAKVVSQQRTLENVLVTSKRQEREDTADVAAPVGLSTLQVVTLSMEFEDPQHPLTAVTSTGRRRSSINNTNVVRPRPYVDSEDDDIEIESVVTGYAPIQDLTVSFTTNV